MIEKRIDKTAAPIQGVDLFNQTLTGNVRNPKNSRGSWRTCCITKCSRRLTPVECERLQGFPDNYTQIPWKGKPKENCLIHEYVALGNSLAVPVMRWMERGLICWIQPTFQIEKS